MKIPPEITYRNVTKTDAIETLIEEKISKLETVCNYINSCHIAVEQPHDRPSSGSPYRVRIDVTVPPGHEIVAENNQNTGNQYEPLDAAIREAFGAAQRQLKKLADQQRQSDKAQDLSTQETTALVTKLFRDQGYGFIRTLDGQEIYFHQNSVLNNNFERLEIGTGVHFFVEEGEDGPQASTVKIVDKPGHRANEAEEASPIEPPLGWQ